MPRQSIEDLGPPPTGYRVDQRTDDPSGVIEFETVETCRREDARRSRALRAAVASGKLTHKERKAALMLIRFLNRPHG